MAHASGASNHMRVKCAILVHTTAACHTSSYYGGVLRRKDTRCSLSVLPRRRPDCTMSIADCDSFKRNIFSRLCVQVDSLHSQTIVHLTSIRTASSCTLKRPLTLPLCVLRQLAVALSRDCSPCTHNVTSMRVQLHLGCDCNVLATPTGATTRPLLGHYPPLNSHVYQPSWSFWSSSALSFSKSGECGKPEYGRRSWGECGRREVSMR